jgi:hypothetical protein
VSKNFFPLFPNFLMPSRHFTLLTLMHRFRIIETDYLDNRYYVTVSTRGRCYDHNFRRKNWRFSQKPMLWSHLFKICLCFESKTPIFFAEYFGENILKTITSVPGWPNWANFCLHMHWAIVYLDQFLKWLEGGWCVHSKIALRSTKTNLPGILIFLIQCELSNKEHLCNI